VGGDKVSGLTTAFLTVANAEAATGGWGDYCLVAATETWYIYVPYSAGTAPARDGLFYLNTGSGGDTRWVAWAGKYLFDGCISRTTISAYRTDATASAVADFNHYHAGATGPVVSARTAGTGDLYTGYLGDVSKFKVTFDGIADLATGYRIGGTAASGNYLRGNGTNFVAGTIQAGDLPNLSGTYSVTGHSHTHTALSDIGTNTHATIDSFISSKAAASGLASLNASSLVVQNPANATETATASKIPIADGSGKLDTWITAGSPSAAGLVKLANHLGGTSLLPTCIGLLETGGQSLLYGAVSDGQYLKRSGTTVIGDTLTAADVAAGSFPSGNFIFNGAIGANNPASIAAQAAHFYDNQHASSNPVVLIYEDDAANAGEVCRIRGDGTGNILTLSNAGADYAVFKDPDTSNGYWHSAMEINPSWGALDHNAYAMRFNPKKTAADAYYAYALFGTIEASHQSGTQNALVGAYLSTYISGVGGTTTEATCIVPQHISTAGTLTTLKLISPSTYLPGGTVTHIYGLYVGNLAVANTSNKYAIRVEEQTGATTNIGAYIGGRTQLYSNITGATNPVLTVTQDHASNTGILLKGVHDGTGKILHLLNGATDRLILDYDGKLTLAGDFAHQGTNLGFYSATPVARSTGWTTFANLSSDKTCDANSTTVEELADILGTLIVQLKTVGLLAA
jgi:hypothetical protein